MLVASVAASCSTGEAVADSANCEDEALTVPTPDLLAGRTEVPMDLLFVEHRDAPTTPTVLRTLGASPQFGAPTGKGR